MGEDDPSEPLLRTASSKATTVASNTSNLLADWWLWEILSASTSVLALFVIAVILLVYDGSSLPDWPSVFTVRPVLLPTAMCR